MCLRFSMSISVSWGLLSSPSLSTHAIFKRVKVLDYSRLMSKFPSRLSFEPNLESKPDSSTSNWIWSSDSLVGGCSMVGLGSSFYSYTEATWLGRNSSTSSSSHNLCAFFTYSLNESIMSRASREATRSAFGSSSSISALVSAMSSMVSSLNP